MKVILMQDVAKIGHRFEIIEVPDGYALNKLIPSRLAEPATPANVKRVEAQKQKTAATAADEAGAFVVAKDSLNGKSITVSVETNKDGKMFEALKPKVVIEAVREQAKVELTESWVHIATPIKATGEHTVLLTLGENQGDFTINVISK